VRGPLTGIRVVELADEQAEYCGLTLAGLGADVVKVEPPGGSPTRRIGPFYEDREGPERSLFFWQYNRGKRSIVLDLHREDDRATFRSLVASADVLIASEKASLGLPEVDVGLLGGCRHAMRLFGHSRVRRMMLTAMRVPGEELYRLGIVEACTTAEGLMPAALEIAQTIASKSPIATRMGKHTLNTIEDMSLRDGYRYEQDMTATISKTEDAKEAQAAFREKRAPSFKGR